MYDSDTSFNQTWDFASNMSVVIYPFVITFLQQNVQLVSEENKVHHYNIWLTRLLHVA